MGSYLDTSWADLRALTRERRAMRKPRTLRFSAWDGASEMFEAIPCEVPHTRRRRKRQAAKWLAQQWLDGVHECGYCEALVVREKDRPNSMTVDHREPWAFGGADDPSNWIVACLVCNRRKGALRECEFRALICAAA